MPPVTALATPFVPTETPGQAQGGAGGQGGLGAIGLAPRQGGAPGGIGSADTAGYSGPPQQAYGYQGGQGGGWPGQPGPTDPRLGGYGGTGYPGPSYPPGGYPGPGYPPPRKRGRGPLIMLVVVVLLALAGTAIFFLHPGGLFKPAASGSPKPTTTVTVTPTSSGSASHSGSGSPASTAPASPSDTVNAYYNAINSKDYATAWNINQYVHSSRTYSQFVNGFSDTNYDKWTITGVSGNVVSIQLTAVHTDGTTYQFHGTYTVSNGHIVGSYILPG